MHIDPAEGRQPSVMLFTSILRPPNATSGLTRKCDFGGLRRPPADCNIRSVRRLLRDALPAAKAVGGAHSFDNK